MIFIYLIIFIISIDNILTTNITKNSSLNRSIIISSCQKDKIESIPIRSDCHYYFYFSSQSSLSLSFSSSILPLLHLSCCEHQQTTSYSSSGFSILYSSLHFPLTDIQDKKHSLSFHHHNAVLSVIDRSSSTSRNIFTLMSSTNEINNQITTTIGSNISLFNTSLSIEIGNHTFNMMLLIGCIIIGIIIIIIIYLIIKYCRRDEGTYKIDESNNFTTKSHLNQPENNGCTGIILSSNHQHQKLLTTIEQKLDDSKEWYV